MLREVLSRRRIDALDLVPPSDRRPRPRRAESCGSCYAEYVFITIGYMVLFGFSMCVAYFPLSDWYASREPFRSYWEPFRPYWEPFRSYWEPFRSYWEPFGSYREPFTFPPFESCREPLTSYRVAPDFLFPPAASGDGIRGRLRTESALIIEPNRLSSLKPSATKPACVASTLVDKQTTNQVDATRVYVDATRVYVDATRAYVDATRVYVDATRVYVDATRIYVDATRVYVDATRVYVDPIRENERCRLVRTGLDTHIKPLLRHSTTGNFDSLPENICGYHVSVSSPVRAPPDTRLFGCPLPQEPAAAILDRVVRAAVGTGCGGHEDRVARVHPHVAAARARAGAQTKPA
eukprot:8018648-Pyramimonas_sp.AAC.3